MAGQLASSSAGAPPPNDAHAHMVSQVARGISISINEETLSYAIQSMANNALKTWCMVATPHVPIRTSPCGTCRR
eukprot:1522665-Pyramimonas_sp.AAC.1